MGYVLKDIANITEPDRVTLSGLPNFIQIASKTAGGTFFTGRVLPNIMLVGANALTNVGFMRPDGTVNAGNSGYRHTAPIDIEGVSKLYILSGSGSLSASPAVFFNASNVRISGVTPSEVGVRYYELTPPAGAKYVVSTCQVIHADIFTVASSLISLNVQDGAGRVRVLRGSLVLGDVGGSVFFMSADALQLAENIKGAFLNDALIEANYDVYSDIEWNEGAPVVNGVILEAKERGAEFNIALTAEGATFTVLSAGSSLDTLRGNEPLIEVSVDLYRENAAQYIHTEAPAGKLGAPIVTLSKTYNGRPLWFDLNGIAGQNLNFTPPTFDTGVWFDTGTLVAFRALVRKGTYSQTPFYISEILYALTGYGSLEDVREMLPYAYTVAPVKTLTEKPVTPYVLGQREYITFLLGAPLAGKQIGVLLRAYNGAGTYLGSQTVGVANTSTLHGVNSCAFDFNDLLGAHPSAVTLSATLVMGGAAISVPQEYTVRPDCLHEVNEFYFLNRLGGWDTFNFDGSTSEDSKPENETFTRTVTPSYNAAQGVEATYLADVEVTKTVQGAPVGDDVAEWLKQLLASKVILDMEGRRILIEDFTLRATAGETVTPVIKYRLSETYTNGY